MGNVIVIFGQNNDLTGMKIFYLLLQFESCIKSVSYFNLFTAQVGYIKFRCEPEKEEKDAFIRSTPRSITQIKKKSF
jgi:hypothetical protein